MWSGSSMKLFDTTVSCLYGNFPEHCLMRQNAHLVGCLWGMTMAPLLAFNCHCCSGVLLWLWALLVSVFSKWLKSQPERIGHEGDLHFSIDAVKACSFGGNHAVLSLRSGDCPLTAFDSTWWMRYIGVSASVDSCSSCTLLPELYKWKVWLSFNFFSLWRVSWGQNQLANPAARGVHMTQKSLSSAPTASVPSVPSACSWALCQHWMCCLAEGLLDLFSSWMSRRVYFRCWLQLTKCDGPMRTRTNRTAWSVFFFACFLNLLRKLTDLPFTGNLWLSAVFVCGGVLQYGLHT